MAQITVSVSEKLVPLLSKPKRIKIAVGGRGGSKSIAFADAFLKFCDDGERLCCAREFQNSIDESVHSLLKSRIEALDANGFKPSATTINSAKGGEIFYKGLARNPMSIKSMFGVKRIWIEEAQTLSQTTIDTLAPTIRETDSELWFSLNRGSSKDPFSVTYLKPYERYLERDGYYEDDDILIVQINYQDNPFFPEVLNRQRLKDKETMPPAKYEHVWGGAYSDSVDNAIIQPDWFDACIDAHKVLGFDPLGQEVVSLDPSDEGDDPAGLSYRHGAVFLDVQQRDFKDINDACDWGTGYANEVKADAYVWDADGMGAGIKRQTSEAFDKKKIDFYGFNGGSTADNPDRIYELIEDDKNRRTNKETFFNKRAQYYWILRDRVYRTFLAVVKGKYQNPDELISFSSQIKELTVLRAEICRIPRKENGSGRIQLLSKKEMRALGIESPNMADSVMMNLMPTNVIKSKKKKSAKIPQAYSAFR